MTGTAVNVTLVPEQTGDEGLPDIEAEGVTGPVTTVMVKILLVAVNGEAHAKLEVITTWIRSPLANVLSE